MNDFQSLLKLVMEMDEVDPAASMASAKKIKTPAFSGKVEDAHTPTEAFQAFKNEHAGHTEVLRTAVHELAGDGGYLTNLSMKLDNFKKSVNSARFDTTNLPADPKKFVRPTGMDRAKIDAAKRYLQPQPSVPPVPGATTEAFEVPGGTDTDASVRSAREHLDTAFKTFLGSVNGLIVRMTTKMASMSSTMSDLETSAADSQGKFEEYKKKFEELESQYADVNQSAGKASVEMHEMNKRLKELESFGREVDQTMITQLRSDLDEVYKQNKIIREKTEVAQKEIQDQLQQALSHAQAGDAARSAASPIHGEMDEKLSEWENAYDQLNAEFERVAQDLIDLKKRFRNAAGTAKAATVMGSAPEENAHHVPKGKFNLHEHLERARIKQGAKPNSGWF